MAASLFDANLFDPTVAQHNLLDAVKKTQNVTVDAVKTLTDLVRPVTERLPQLPFADRLPAPGTGIEAGYAFVEELLASQKAFTKELVEVLTSASRSES